MPSNSVRILDLDGSIVRQRNLISRYQPHVLNLTDLGPRARFWLDKTTRGKIQERLCGSDRHAITLVGSGDFHGVSNLLIEQFPHALCVITFDFHPDWDILPPRLHCGAWVTETLKQQNIVKFILIGVSSGDISTGRLQTGNLRSLQDDRLEIYPYAHKPSWVLGRDVPSNISVHVRKGLFSSVLHWTSLKGRDIAEFFGAILQRLPTREVYVSIDKDCLQNTDALTNWEEGKMSLEELLLMLRLIRENADIVGVDITGDYSPIRVEGWGKRLLSWMDHPRRVPAQDMPPADVAALNERTNIKILDTLNS